MKLTVVILNYNTAPFLELCVDSVLRAVKHIDAQVIVVDNNSTDHSLEMLESTYKNQVEVLALDTNYGFAKSNNLAVKQAKGEYLCILNPDTIVPEMVFEECIEFIESIDERVAFIGVQLVDGTGSFLQESKRNVPTPSVARNKLLGNSSSYYAYHVSKNGRASVDVLVGAFMFCKTAVYKELGGFDERYFMYGEDIDLSYTAIKAGYVNYYLGDVKVIHFKGESTVKDRVYLDRFYNAMQLFYEKHFEQNALEKRLVKLGLGQLKRLNTIRIAFNKKLPIQTVASILVSNKLGNLHIEHCENKDMEYVETHKFPQNTLFIWDTHTVSFMDIIDFMTARNSNQHVFRFLSNHRDFILGSDTSDTMGQVTKLH